MHIYMVLHPRSLLFVFQHVAQAARAEMDRTLTEVINTQPPSSGKDSKGGGGADKRKLPQNQNGGGGGKKDKPEQIKSH